MAWNVLFCEEFITELKEDLNLFDEILAHAKLIEQIGPVLGRPKVDTLYDSRHSNMKELRFDFDGGVYRVAFAFDPERQAVFLVAGDKKGKNERKFYKSLIAKADQRYEKHLKRLEEK